MIKWERHLESFLYKIRKDLVMYIKHMIVSKTKQSEKIANRRKALKQEVLR